MSRLHPGPLGRHAATGALILGLVALAATTIQAQTFTPVASPAIASHNAFSTGATWVDYDADGDLDLYVVTGFSPNNSNVLYRNEGAGVFTRIVGTPETQDSSDTACSTWADYDNDGDVDCFISNLVSNGGMLFENQGGGNLTLNTTAGLGGAGLKGAGCAWGDYDNDGYVDLVIAALIGQGGITTGNRLFHNNANGTFTEVTSGPEVATQDSHHHPTWSDYDGDGDLDLFFATGGVGITHKDRMYKNLRKETGSADFIPIFTPPIATELRDSQSLIWVDYDNDGDLDLFAVNYTSVPNQLYRQDPGGVFTKITTGPLVTDMGSAHGAVWGDFDNDGDQDVYVARDLNQKNRYYRNEGDGTFTSVTVGAFVNDVLSNYGVAAGDYDGDGDLDLFVPTARSEGASVLYQNDPGNDNRWLEFHLEGTLSNRSAIGAKVHVLATFDGVPRWQMREILATTSYGGSGALEAHFGMGHALRADSVIVEWPRGTRDVYTSIPCEQRVSLVESIPPVGAPFGSSAARFLLSVSPSPFRDSATIRYRLAHEGATRVELRDISGRHLATLLSAVQGAGEHTVALRANRLPAAGVYLVRLVSGSAETSRRVVLMK